MLEQTVEIPALDGAVTTFIVHPEREGPHPVVLMFMDAPQPGEEPQDMARRLASVGYYVMLPQLHRRRGEAGAAARPRGMGGLVTAEVMDDADRLLAFADQDAAASPGRAGCIGYCLSGQYAMNFAARHPERIGAAAAICGVKLVTDRDDSPHLALARVRAEVYFGCAGEDEWAPAEVLDVLEQATREHAPSGEVEIYEDARHGFVFPSRPVYDRVAAERHWERIFFLFRRRLRTAQAA